MRWFNSNRKAWTEDHWPRHQQPGDLLPQSVCHLATADVGHAVQGQVDVHRVAAGQVILDGLDHQLHQLWAGAHQHRDEQVALQTRQPSGSAGCPQTEVCLHGWMGEWSFYDVGIKNFHARKVWSLSGGSCGGGWHTFSQMHTVRSSERETAKDGERERERYRQTDNNDNTNDSCLEPALSSGGGSFFHAYKDSTLWGKGRQIIPYLHFFKQNKTEISLCLSAPVQLF